MKSRTVLLVVGLAIVLGGCAAEPERASRAAPGAESRVDGAALLASDIDRLVGKPWGGTLTYLDYTSKKPRTIDSSLVVRRTSSNPARWSLSVGYSKEPQADSSEIVELSADGARLGDERVISRSLQPDGTLVFMTETTGQDDRRAATFRFEHRITATQYSRQKLVRFDGEEAFFERNIYRWSR
jgi:hypothetical protein